MLGPECSGQNARNWVPAAVSKATANSHRLCFPFLGGASPFLGGLQGKVCEASIRFAPERCENRNS